MPDPSADIDRLLFGAHLYQSLDQALTGLGDGLHLLFQDRHFTHQMAERTNVSGNVGDPFLNWNLSGFSRLPDTRGFTPAAGYREGDPNVRLWLKADSWLGEFRSKKSGEILEAVGRQGALHIIALPRKAPERQCKHLEKAIAVGIEVGFVHA